VLGSQHPASGLPDHWLIVNEKNCFGSVHLAGSGSFEHDEMKTFLFKISGRWNQQFSLPGKTTSPYAMPSSAAPAVVNCTGF
jgi:hypothetical protein